VVLKQAASSPDISDNTIATARRLFNLDRELKKPVHGKTEESPVPETLEQGSGKESTCR
jgi:hypothetical protein